jgi:uncharacterized protein (TIGR01777 family)
MASKILITGGTGLVGSVLVNELRKKKYEVRLLTTQAIRANGHDFFYWNPKDGYIDAKAFDGVDAIVHLAGTAVAEKRWTKKRKKEIYESRVDATRLLHRFAKRHHIGTLVAASAVGYYGFDTGDVLMTEDMPAGTEFLAYVVRDWEGAIREFESETASVSIFRIGIVLTTKGGALKELLRPIKWGVGSHLGTGRQYMSWIHLDDLVGMIIMAMERQLSGTFNAVAPHPVTNKEFTREVAAVLGKKLWLPAVPGFLLKLAFGELALVVLGGNNVSADRIIKAGYTFRFKRLPEALKNLLKK